MLSRVVNRITTELRQHRLSPDIHSERKPLSGYCSLLRLYQFFLLYNIAQPLSIPNLNNFMVASKNHSASDAQSDFSSDCIEISQAYCRMSRNLCARWRKICKHMRC